MNKKYAKVQSTRRSLIMSILSLMLCFAMLIGTTYAWFTDSVTSGRNKIVAGNLDVELYHSKTLPVAKTTPNSVADATDLFGIAKWEPGVIAYENFMVSNVGTLALKYAMTLNIYDKNTFKGHDLSEVIKVAVVENGFSGDRAAAQTLSFEPLADFQKQGNLLAGKDDAPYGIVLYWEPTDNDNLYNVNNGQKTDDNGTELFIEFGINLVATQDTVESDSFDKYYDKTASYELNFAKMTEKLKEDGTEDLKVKKTGIIEEAKVPAKAANDVFDELSLQAPTEFKKEDGSLKDDVSQELVLTLDVEDKGAKNSKQTFNIDMTAVMTFTEGAKTETVTKNVTNLSDFVYVDVQVAKDLVVDGVKHNDKDMKNAATPDGTNDDNGYYNYKATEGLLRLIMKSFSPFTMTWQELQVVTPTSTPVSATIDGMSDIWHGSFNSDTGKYETVPTTGAEAGMYDLVLYFSNLNPGDTVYFTFDEEPQNNDNEWIVFVANNEKIVPTGKTAKFTVGTINAPALRIKQAKANKVSIKVDHQEPPVIVAQPTVANPMVAATGEDLHYQWCKENSTVVDNDSQKAVYAEGYEASSLGSVKSKTEFKNNRWECTVTSRNELVVLLHGVSAGDIVTFNAESGKGTKVSLESVDGNTEYYKLEQNASNYSVQIPEGVNSSCKLTVKFNSNDFISSNFAGTVSIQKLTPIANGTGPKLETTEPGTYFCKVSNRVGTVISDKVTIN